MRADTATRAGLWIPFLFLWRRTARRDSVFFRLLHGAKARVFAARKWGARGASGVGGLFGNHHLLDARSAHNRPRQPADKCRHGQNSSENLHTRIAEPPPAFGFTAHTAHKA